MGEINLGDIESAIVVVLALLHASIDYMTLRIIACNIRQGRPSKLPAINGEIDNQCQDAEYLNSVNMNDSMRMDNDGDTLETSKFLQLPLRMYKWELQYAETDKELVTT